MFVQVNYPSTSAIELVRRPSRRSKPSGIKLNDQCTCQISGSLPRRQGAEPYAAPSPIMGSRNTSHSNDSSRDSSRFKAFEHQNRSEENDCHSSVSHAVYTYILCFLLDTAALFPLLAEFSHGSSGYSPEAPRELRWKYYRDLFCCFSSSRIKRTTSSDSL